MGTPQKGETEKLQYCKISGNKEGKSGDCISADIYPTPTYSTELSSCSVSLLLISIKLTISLKIVPYTLAPMQNKLSLWRLFSS